LDKVSISLTNKEFLVNTNKIFIPLIALKLITGQKPKITKAKKSIAQFKLREGKALGCKLTLRNEKMFYFLDKFVYGILPQLIELKTKKYKANLNSLTIGIEDLSIFYELENQYDLLKNSQGLNITIMLKNNRVKKKSSCFFSGLKIPVTYK
jgi:large subunit ribosomal protein L5